MTQLDLIGRQAEAALKNQISGAVADAKRKTSLVGEASQLIGAASRQGNAWIGGATQQRKQSRRNGHGRTAPVSTPQPVRPAEDGYVRKSPVQEIRVAEDYGRRILRRVLGVAAVAVVIITILWFLVASHMISL